MTEQDLSLFAELKENIRLLAEKYFEKNIRYCDEMNFLGVEVSHDVTITYLELYYTGEYEMNKKHISYEDFLKG